MKLPILMLAAPIALLAACDSETAASSSLSVSNATIFANPVEGRPSAAYFTVHAGPEPVQLISVNVNAAQKTEMHRTMNNKGVMSMEAITAVSIPAGGTAEFKQGGNHAMVYGLPPVTIDSGKTKIFFAFSNGKRITVEAKISKAGQGADHGEAH